VSDTELKQDGPVRSSDPYSRTSDEFREPPQGFWATLRQLGPGMILAGSIVGSGELIMTTKLGAVAGFALLWFVLLSCFVKVVVAAELARHTISSGRTFLHVFNALPGPASRRPVWLTLPWMGSVIGACVLGTAVYVRLDPQVAPWRVAVPLVGGVVAVSIAAAWLICLRMRRPGIENLANERPRVNWFLWLWLATTLLGFVNSGAILGGAGQTLQLAVPGLLGDDGARVWAVAVGALAAIILLTGSYAPLEKTLIALVVMFTLLTVLCTVLLQWTGFAITWDEVSSGLTFGLPDKVTAGVMATALAMYAGTGVAYGEMWSYTYWCVEKGYARNVGEPQAGDQWAKRARGWIRVMYTDVLVTMVVYTISTVCFYLLGAAILHAKHLDPEGPDTLLTLSATFVESLGSWASTLFVVGAFFVLFSTVLAGVAGSSRLMADALGVLGIIDSSNYSARLRFIRIFVVVSVVLFSIAYWLFENPPMMLGVTSSVIGALVYPVLGLGVLYLRHRQVDPRIVPGTATTVWLWICGLALAVISPVGILLALAIKLAG